MAAPTAYRPNVGVILVNRDGLVFVAARLDNPADAWQMPQGGIDKDEDPRVAALRELEEEIGTGKAEIVAESEGWHEYDLPPELVGRMWGGKYRGQKQKWFVMRFLGKDKDIDIHTKHPEFRDWKWVPFEQVPDLIVPFKRDLYQELLATFGEVVKGIGTGA
ncbi:RNA pyrophosphohydrolase [Emcibacter sp. SYSU 3D8]|uniref:RNA pyrophosphohydrolase n=1 Tax=Emcibacter sp. SYSU 3D8 TaxID=3133969 RepID=UPI0031FF2D61